MSMTAWQHRAKLSELRARTDRDLVALIEHRLDQGLESDGAAAEQIYLEVAPLLLIANANRIDRSRLEAKLERLAECFGAACAPA